MNLRVIVLSGLLVLMALRSFGAENSPADSRPGFPADIRMEASVAYLPESRKEKADLYFPKETPKGRKLPAVVIIHGGGWSGGKRDAAREINIGSTLARNGYIGMSIDYKLSYNKQAVWPTNLWDCKIAVRWLRVNAGKLGVDPDRIGVIGGSAGGHLSAMMALTMPEDGLDPTEPYGNVSCAVKCGIDLYGPADLATYHDVGMLGKTFAEAPELYRKASPVTYIRSNSPPILILHGTADTTVKVRQSEIFAAKLKEAGVTHELVVIPDAPHTFHLQPAQRDLRPVVLGFLNRYLKGQTATAPK